MLVIGYLVILVINCLVTFVVIFVKFRDLVVIIYLCLDLNFNWVAFLDPNSNSAFTKLFEGVNSDLN